MAIDAAGPTNFTDLKMVGMVDVSDDALASDSNRNVIMGLALDFVKALPAK